MINQLMESFIKPVLATTLAAVAWVASRLETASSVIDLGVDVLALVTAFFTALWAFNRLKKQREDYRDD